MSEFESNLRSRRIGRRPFLAALGLSALALLSCESSRVISLPPPLPTRVPPTSEIPPSPEPPVAATPSRFPPTASPWIHVSRN